MLVGAGFHNKILSGGITNKNLFFKALEAVKLKIKVLAWLVSGKAPILGLQMATFLLCSQNEKSKLSRDS